MVYPFTGRPSYRQCHIGSNSPLDRSPRRRCVEHEATPASDILTSETLEIGDVSSDREHPLNIQLARPRASATSLKPVSCRTQIETGGGELKGTGGCCGPTIAPRRQATSFGEAASGGLYEECARRAADQSSFCILDTSLGKGNLLCLAHDRSAH